ncbi:MAG: hypothetical protein DRI79_04020 [Chloroflexi bacterium]|nr:MAG: hypothetical protein DRI79_04020 [Chloroflexota bacterium]
MSLRKLPLLILCTVCLVTAGCQAGNGLTASGSDEWSRGVVLGTTEAYTVAVAVWKDTTFVVWVGEGGQLQLAQLDRALRLRCVTNLVLSAVYPRDMQLQAEAVDRLHLAWIDRATGITSVVYAQLVPGQTEPAFRREIPLPAEAVHVRTAMRPTAGRLEILWSDLSGRNSGIYHQAVSLASDEIAPAVRLTETGSRPGVAIAPSGGIHVVWTDEGSRGRVAIWHAKFDPDSQSLCAPALAAEVQLLRQYAFYGPAVGGAETWAVVAWSTGRRSTAHGMYRAEQPPWVRQAPDAPAPAGPGGGTVSSVGEQAQYAMVSFAASEAAPAAHSLAGDRLVWMLEAVRLRTAGGRPWAVLSGWVKVRSSLLLQVVAVPFDEEGPGDLTVVTGTRHPSLWPDMAAGADGTLRMAWLEAARDGEFQVVVASTAPEARAALGGPRLSEWLDSAAALLFDGLSLLSYAPIVIAWVFLPVGLIVVATWVSGTDLRERRTLAWLGATVLLHLTCKRILAPTMMLLGSDPMQVAFSLVPIGVGIGLMAVYRWRAEHPSLPVAYGLFVAVDTVFSLFVVLPRVLWIAE